MGKKAEEKQTGAVTGAALNLGTAFPLRLELVLRNPPPTDEHEDPFVILSDSPERARVYLGRIMAGDHTAVRLVAIKTQPPAGEPSGLEGRALRPGERRARWEREWRHYVALAASGVGTGTTPVLFIQGGDPRRGEQPVPVVWPPLLYAPETGRLVRARTPAGAPLAVCNDRDKLAEHGLPTDGEAVFLYDPSGADDALYQVPIKGQEQATKATEFERCLDGMASLASDPSGALNLGTSEGIEQAADLAAELPALRTPEGLPARLVPWRLEGVQAMVLELNALHFDEFCDILGGADEKSFNARYRGPEGAIGQRLRLAQAPFEVLRERPLLFSNDASGLDALEIFRLKWSLFAQACLAVLQFHRRAGAPHLRLNPRHVMVEVDAGGAYLPALWKFETRLISLGSPTLELRELPAGDEIYVPPIGTDPLYEADLVRNSSFGLAQRGDFMLTGVEEQGDAATVAFQVHHDGIGLRWLGDKDHVLVKLGRHLVAEAEIEMLARWDTAHNYTARALHLKSLPLKLDAAKRAALEKLRGIRVPNAEFRLLPALNVPCDLYSLGMLLFRALVVNDNTSIGEVSVALDGLRQDLASLAAIECEPGQEAYYWETLLSGHRDSAVQRMFARDQVFYGEFERTKERPNAIPKNLWNEALAIGMKLVTTFENFSYCANHGDYDATSPSATMEPLVRQVEELGRKLDTALFGLTARNAEVRQALEMVLQEVTEG